MRIQCDFCESSRIEKYMRHCYGCETNYCVHRRCAGKHTIGYCRRKQNRKLMEMLTKIYRLLEMNLEE